MILSFIFNNWIFIDFILMLTPAIPLYFAIYLTDLPGNFHKISNAGIICIFISILLFILLAIRDYFFSLNHGWQFWRGD